MMMTSQQTRLQVMDVLDRMAAYYSRKDLDNLLSLIAPEISGFGSGPDEFIRNREEYRRHVDRDFSQSGVLAMALSDILICAEGTVAWVSCSCTITTEEGGCILALGGRMTAVLRGTGYTWIFTQIHFSLPAADQAPGKSFPAST
jgi:ketosteroid isomerase-like protein